MPKCMKLDRCICIICLQRIPDKPHKDIVQSPTAKGLETLLDIAKSRQDRVNNFLSPFREDILSLRLEVRFHKSCRATYTNKFYSVEPTPETDTLPESASESTLKRKSPRDGEVGFNIRTHCFICGRVKKLGNRKEPLTCIEMGTGKPTREKTMKAAIERNDTVVHSRMILYKDLFAYDAKYHRSCYGHYISERNVRYQVPGEDIIIESTLHDQAFQILSDEMKKTIFSELKTVATLSELNRRFIEILHSTGIPAESADSYKARKLKQRLSKQFGDEISFISRKGQTDLVCCSTVSVGVVLTKAAKLQSELSDSNDSFEPEQVDTVLTDKQVLYRAASVIRDAIKDIQSTKEAYRLSDLSPEKCGEIVPSPMYDFIHWLVNSKAFMEATDSSEECSRRNNIQVVAICHSLISQSRHILTPMSLGLALNVYHDFGSCKLVRTLHTLGYGASYDEVMRFVTSAAKHQMSKDQQPFVPFGIQTANPENGIGLVHAAIDNFDTNENTLDGKGTTHSMAMVVYQTFQQDRPVSDVEIPRLSDRSVTAEEGGTDTSDVKYFQKPPKRPEPVVDVNTDDFLIDTENSHTHEAVISDLTWALCRAYLAGIDNIPAWSGYNSFTTSRSIPVTSIKYLPFINAPPSDVSTIFTSLEQLVRLAEKVGQNHIIVTADLAIYSKAIEMLWTKPPSLEGKVTMRLGGMHHTMAFLASIGKLFADGGLLSLLTDSDLYSEATARQMMNGAQLTRGVRGVKVILDAMCRCFFEGFIDWLVANGEESQPHVGKKIEKLRDAFNDMNVEGCKEGRTALESELQVTEERIRAFQSAGETQSSTFKFWMNFMEAAFLLLRLLRAERDADFDLHLQSVTESVHWFWAAGRTNYARYTPVYIADMLALKTSNPEAYAHLQDGGFVVRRSPGHAFNSVPTDQALEQTINKEAKGSGGIIGFTRRKGALTRWLVTRHILGEFGGKFKLTLSKDTDTSQHEDMGKNRQKRDETDVGKVVDLINNQYQNPFDLNTVPDNLVNIASGQVASEEIEKSLNEFRDVSQEAVNQYVSERLSNERSVKFWNPIPRSKIRTFANMRKPFSVDKTSKLMLDSEVLFRRLLAVANNRDIDMKEVLQHELASVPPALFHDDGSMRKTNKAELAKKLESLTDEVNELPIQPAPSTKSTAYIIDGMAMIQALNEAHFKTFDELGSVVLKQVMSHFTRNATISTVTVVFDRYDNENSLKVAERQRRAGQSDAPVYMVSGGRVVPNYRRFLSNTQNKSSLADFVSGYVAENSPHQLKDGLSIVLSGGFRNGREVRVVTSNGSEQLPDLFSNQEEADTRMVLHATKLVEAHNRIIIRTDDTDVLVILIYYYFPTFKGHEVYMHTGHRTRYTFRNRYIPVHVIAEKIGPVVSSCLPAMHALTGCDTNSSIYKVGKRTALSKLTQNIGRLKDLSRVHASESVEECLPVTRTYAMMLFGGTKNKSTGKPYSSMNEIRFSMATSTDKSATQLPPTEDAFKHHVMRARVQTIIWCQSHAPDPDIPDPVGNGWKRAEDGKLVHVYFSKPPAPVFMRDLTHLYCKDRDCNTSKCQCSAVGLPCIDICLCQGECSNKESGDSSDLDSEDELA